MPRQALNVQLLHEGIGIELLNVPHTGLAPQAFEEHHGTNHCGNTCCVADALHTGLLVSLLVAAVVVYVVCTLLTVLDTADTATDRCLALVVLAQILRVRQYSLEELQRNDLLTVVGVRD